jgi:hypothetical protein
MPPAFVVHFQKSTQALLVIALGPCRESRQGFAKQRRQLAPRGRQPGLVPIQKLQSFLLSRILFHAQQVGKIFFGFGYVDKCMSIKNILYYV